MASSPEYKIVVTVTNEAGEVIERACTVPAGPRPWSLLQREEAKALLEHLLFDWGSKPKYRGPGWSACWE